MKRHTLEFKSVPVQVNQVKEEFSLQNSSHQLALTATLLCIKYNGETQHEKLISFVLFPLLLMHFKWKKTPYVALA